MAKDRIQNALGVIGVTAGLDEKQKTEADLVGKNAAQIDDSLSIGGFRGLLKSEPETHRRSLVRAVLLARLAQGKLQLAGVANSQRDLLTMNTGRLERELFAQFPYKPYRGSFAKRADWAPVHFSDPWHHANSKYMYMIHGIGASPSIAAEYMPGASVTELENFQNIREKYLAFSQVDKSNKFKTKLNVRFYEEYLDNPKVIQTNIISSSVINQDKHAAYYPIGFIMRVPPECIYITSPRDVAVKNRVSPEKLIEELQTKSAGTGTAILKPEEILAQTTGTEGSEHYNEIVLVGSSPEGKHVEVTGIYVKTDAKGNLYKRPDQAGPYANDEVQKMIAASSKKFNLPIVPIRDLSSDTSTFAWPFKDNRLQTEVQMTSRARSVSI